MPDISAPHRKALAALAAELARIFRERLVSVVAYRPSGGATDAHPHTLVLVTTLRFEDLHACLPFVSGWRGRGFAVPLILEEEEFRRTLDVFPLEYGGIVASHVVIHGTNPFEGIAIASQDVRRACELQAKSHLIHLREGFLETQGEAAAVASLITASAGAFRALLANIARLPDSNGGAPPIHESDESLAHDAEARIGIPATLVRDVLASSGSGSLTIADPTALLARYVAAAERVWEYVDAWRP